jgi:hypothetical protein
MKVAGTQLASSLSRMTAEIEGGRFNTLSSLGVNEDGGYSLRLFEDHGFYCHYEVARGDVWTLR